MEICLIMELEVGTISGLFFLVGFGFTERQKEQSPIMLSSFDGPLSKYEAMQLREIITMQTHIFKVFLLPIHNMTVKGGEHDKQ